LPIRVTPPPPAVPMLTVTYSRNVLPSPMTTSVSSPRYLRSWGVPPMTAYGWMTLFRPIVVRPVTVTWFWMTVPGPIVTEGPTTL
jgi:hypothetical protein